MKFKDTKYGDLTGSTYEGNIDVLKMNLTSLEGSPKVVKGNFNCAFNKELTSLEGAPKTVNGDFWCYNSKLTSLEGSPKSVGGDFYCYDNNLTSLEGSPKSVGGPFNCAGNKSLTQDDIWTLLDSDIKGTIEVPEGLTPPTKEDYKLFNKLNKNLKKFIKLKTLKDKLK